ncbi:DUF58 domain-containing protein [Candidatus Woesearchaeota archaeon]|nr:DUF58 domain-containing protein [Candidatus Woesearchaeota archaeon]
MVLDTSFLRQLDRFELIMARKINSPFQGERQSTAGGQGLVIKDFSQYSPGDDFRKIDWKVFARTDKLYIKRYEEERNLTVHILIDFSGSMNFGQKHKKSEYAAMVGLGFAYMALKNNERFILSTFSDKIEVFKPKRGRRQLAAMVDYLSSKRSENITNFEESLGQYYKAMVKNRSMIIIISDFLYPIEQIKNTLIRFKDHQVKLIQVLDDIELNLQLEGDFKLVDSETKTHLRTFLSPYLRKNYLGALQTHNAAIQSIANQIRGQFVTVSSSNELFDTFYHILG